MAGFLRRLAAGRSPDGYRTINTVTVIRRFHPAWAVAAVAFVALVGAAGFRATPGVLLHPLHAEFGWPLGVISAADATVKYDTADSSERRNTGDSDASES
jgi:hypothetical protein